MGKATRYVAHRNVDILIDSILCTLLRGGASSCNTSIAFQLRERFHELTCQMQQASKWKEAITGEPYDLDFLKDILTQMDLRQELWKYIEVSIHSIREWKTILFRKVGGVSAVS